ncbi:MAG: TolC family protein [Opitutales bacterium]
MLRLFHIYLAAGTLAASLALATPLPAQERGEAPSGLKLDGLESYLTRAQSANPQLEAFRQRYEAAMQRIPQTSALPDPMLQITSFVESVQTRTGPQENVLMLSQKIPWFGKLSSREEVASAEAEALWFAYQNQQLMLARRVSLAFYEYAYLKDAIRLTRENLKLLEGLEPIVEEKVRSGADLNALLRLKVEIGRVDDQAQSLEQKRIAQSARLAELLALPTDALLPFPEWSQPEVVSPDGPSMIRAMEANHPELKMLERKVESAAARREIARLESYPDITLGINYIQVGDPEVMRNTPDAGRDPWGVTVAVNLPIWFGKNNAAKAEALATQRAHENERGNRLNQLRAELSASFARLKDANRQLALYGEELLGLAEQAVENSRSAYEGGRTGILEVIDSERSLLDLQLLYRRAAADAWQQRIVIQTLAGQPLLENFDATDTSEPQKAQKTQN